MFEVRQTSEYSSWFARLRDANAKARIDVRIRRMSLGNLGDAKFFGGIGELRIDYGPGYRVYFVKRGDVLIILLCGGSKSTQTSDITLAKAIAARLKEN
jgi:putative addiction module killer protein